MNLRKLVLVSFIIALLIPTVVTSFAQTDQLVAVNSNCAVELFCPKQVVLNREAVQELYATSLSLLKTSQFNSRANRWPISEVQKDYRLTISGKYLLVSFKAPRTVTTVGGEVSALEIVVGLDGSHFSGMFTIDAEGRIVEQGKFNGSGWIGLVKLADNIAGGD